MSSTVKTTCRQCGFVLTSGAAGPCPECGGNINHEVSLVAMAGARVEVNGIVVDPRISQEIILAAPALSIMMQLLRQSRDLDSLSPRELEKLIEQLLDADGWMTKLGRGQKDGGWDVWAEKDLGASGFVAAIWQAKKPQEIKNRVDVGVVRELYGTLGLQNVNRGVIATTSYLTKDALTLVQQDKFHLGKCDRDDFREWLQRHARL